MSCLSNDYTRVICITVRAGVSSFGIIAELYIVLFAGGTENIYKKKPRIYSYSRFELHINIYIYKSRTYLSYGQKTGALRVFRSGYCRWCFSRESERERDTRI